MQRKITKELYGKTCPVVDANSAQNSLVEKTLYLIDLFPYK